MLVKCRGYGRGGALNVWFDSVHPYMSDNADPHSIYGIK